MDLDDEKENIQPHQQINNSGKSKNNKNNKNILIFQDLNQNVIGFVNKEAKFNQQSIDQKSVAQIILDSIKKKKNSHEPGPLTKDKHHNKKSHMSKYSFEIVEDNNVLVMKIPMTKKENISMKETILSNNYVQYKNDLIIPSLKPITNDSIKFNLKIKDLKNEDLEETKIIDVRQSNATGAYPKSIESGVRKSMNPPIIPTNSTDEIQKWLSDQFFNHFNENGTIIESEDLEETTIIDGSQSVETAAYRKSIVPGGRKSIMPPIQNDEQQPRHKAINQILIPIQEYNEEDENGSPKTYNKKTGTIPKISLKNKSQKKTMSLLTSSTLLSPQQRETFGDDTEKLSSLMKITETMSSETGNLLLISYAMCFNLSKLNIIVSGLLCVNLI